MNPVPANERADSGQQCESTQPLSGQTIDLAHEGERAEPTTDINGEVKADSSLTVDVPSDSGGSDVESVDTLLPEQKTKPRELPLAAAPPGYEILGVLGRGGMGVVYDARQIALKRRVALKMVTAGAHTGPAERTRFQVEAEAVAALQHPNIVQIYEVGEHDGIPYFSLEYVGGGSLERKIKRQPMPPRDAAGLVQSLAVAMDYAHERGIVHRDLKPANVLMTADGLPKITDFGLAKRLGDSDSSQTQAGTILGTPSYMAPEQAEGEIKEVGTLADVYSLGAVLYQLLTGRPPFQGTTMLETLELVRTQEPVPVRQLQPKVARDLETICLKCLQKQPAKRYIDAGALATDLGHFLANEPIEARPVGRVERLWRWCHRNPGIAALTAAVFLLLATVAVTSSVMAVRIAFEHAEAVKARDLALQNEIVAREAEKKATDNERIAIEQGDLAVNTLYNVVTRVQTELGSQPGNQKIRQNVLTDAVAGLQKVVSSAADSPRSRRIRAIVHQRMGDISRELGKTNETLRYYKECQSAIDAMAVDDPGNQVTMYNRAVLYMKLGDINQELLCDGAVVRGYYEKSLELRRALAQAPIRDPELQPENEKVTLPLAEIYLKLGNLSLFMGDPEAAWGHYQKLLEFQFGRTFPLPRDALAAANSAAPLAEIAKSSVVAAATAGPAAAGAAAGPAGAVAALAVAISRQFSESRSRTLGDVSFHLGDATTARSWYDRALRFGESAVRSDPNSVAKKGVLAGALAALGDLELQLGNPAKAKERYAKAHELYEKIAALDADASGPRRNLSLSHYRLGTAHRRLGEPDADEHYRKCLQLRQVLENEDPENAHKQIDLTVILARCGQHALAAERAENLRKRSPQDPGMLFQSACTYALCAEAVARSHDGQGASGLKQRYVALALETLGRSIDCGYRDVVALRTDPDLDPIRAEPLFQDMLKTLDRRK